MILEALPRQLSDDHLCDLLGVLRHDRRNLPIADIFVSHRPEGLDDADELIRLKHPTAPRRGAPAPAE